MDNEFIDFAELLQTQISPEAAYLCAEQAARKLGFDYALYGHRQFTSISRPKVQIFTNYAPIWMQHYQSMGYANVDPTVKQAVCTGGLVVWDNALFADHKTLWVDAQDHGLKVGLAVSAMHKPGEIGLLVFARSNDALSLQEQRHTEAQIRWIAHSLEQRMVSFQANLSPPLGVLNTPFSLEKCPLTERELEVLRWTADGKTAEDIADILNITQRTANFHLHQIMERLGTPNKTSAVVRALIKGWLY